MQEGCPNIDNTLEKDCWSCNLWYIGECETFYRQWLVTDEVLAILYLALHKGLRKVTMAGSMVANNSALHNTWESKEESEVLCNITRANWMCYIHILYTIHQIRLHAVLKKTDPVETKLSHLPAGKHL